MESITWKDMKAIDLNCEQLGLLPIQLMENAGSAIAEEIKKRFIQGNILFVAGRGNNGGDAAVAARHLCQFTQFNINFILLGNVSSIKTLEAKSNFSLLKHCKVNKIKEISNIQNLDIMNLIEEADVIVDGILGTGIIGDIKEPESSVIDLINMSNKYILSIDTPSGGYSNQNIKYIKANSTITFHKMKKELETLPITNFTGELKVAHIGICNNAELFVGNGNLKNLFKRNENSHKGQSGKLLIIAGGAYSGAPALAAMAALRVGVDIVTLATPMNVADIIASFSPNLIVHKLSKSRLCDDDLPDITKLIKKHDTVVIGMGLGNDINIIQTVKKIIPLCKKLVIDADALDAVENIPYLNQEIVITPHKTEFERISQTKLSQDVDLRIKQIVDYSTARNIITLLKGKTDIIADGKKVFLNKTGNSGMSVGGTGDVLAGIVGALLTVNTPLQAASCAAYINGSAGDLAFLEKGYGLLATDVISKIVDIIKN